MSTKKINLKKLLPIFIGVFCIYYSFKDISFSEFKEILRNKNPIFLEVFKDKSVKYFLNLTEIIDTNIFLKEGDEIAFLPPVTGG